VAYEWRPLQHDKSIPELKGTELVLSVALQKSFARRPAYWVDVYCQPRSKLPDQYFVALQWSFKRQTEVIEGHFVKAGPQLAVATTAAVVQEQLETKVNEKWIIKGTQVDPKFRGKPIVQQVGRVVDLTAAKGTDNGQATPELVVEERHEVAKSRAERFQEKQAERRAKAEW